MTTKSLFTLEGKKLNRIEKVHDYIQLYFADGSIVSIYNRYSLEPDDLDAFRNSDLQYILR